MAANLPPTYHDAENRFRAATSTEDKLAALEEMLRVIPKHKGTEKLQAGIKSRMAKLRQQPRRSAVHGHGHHVPREGAGQVALVGPPNSGKSSLVARLTHARAEIADYPFSTREALPGMMAFEDVALQLVDLPPLSETFVEPWVYDLIRAADLLWIVVESSSSLDGLASVERLLAARNIEIAPAGSGAGAAEARAGVVRKPAMLVVSGADHAGAADELEILRELLDRPWPVHAVSAVDGQGLDELGRASFHALSLIRVYTKQPGKPADTAAPFTLPAGATVGDLARTIHKDLVESMKFARIWGASVFDGQPVQREHVLHDRDTVEIHT